mgnify:CR=1 FL=1
MFMLLPTLTLRRSTGLLCAAIALLTAPGALAQSVTGPADINRVQERVAQPRVIAPSDDLIQVEGRSAAAAPRGAEKIKLKLADVTFAGMTVYPDAQIAPLYRDKIGQTITVADVYQLAADLTRQYRNDGYILTQVVVPPQTIEGGHVKLMVVEGYISDVTVEGDNTDTERALIASYANHLKDRPLNTRELEKAILLTNDLPGVSARSIISPALNHAGAAQLRIVTERKSYNALLSADNYGSRFLGPLQLQGALSGNSLLGMNERITTDLIYAPDGSELAYGDLIYTQPIGSWGTRLEVKGALAASDPGYILKPFDINGRAVTLSVRIDQPIWRTRAENWSVYGLLEGRNNMTQSNADITRKDRIRAIRLGTDYDRIDSLFGGGFNSLNLELAQGLDLLNASDEGDTNLSRTAGDPQFTKMEAEFQRLQRLTTGVNLLLGVRGQIADEAMLSSEEFGVGGPQYGRGYDPSEIVGDDGIAGKLEVQFNDPVPASFLKTYQLYGFLDGGRVWNDDATTAADREISVISTGIGVRATLKTNTEAGMYVALPLNRDVQTLGNEDPRVFVNVNHKF